MLKLMCFLICSIWSSSLPSITTKSAGSIFSVLSSLLRPTGTFFGQRCCISGCWKAFSPSSYWCRAASLRCYFKKIPIDCLRRIKVPIPDKVCFVFWVLDCDRLCKVLLQCLSNLPPSRWRQSFQSFWTLWWIGWPNKFCLNLHHRQSGWVLPTAMMNGSLDAPGWVCESLSLASGSRMSSGQFTTLLDVLIKAAGDNRRWASFMCFCSCSWLSWNDFLSLRNWIIVFGTYSRFIAFLELKVLDKVRVSMPLDLVNRPESTSSFFWLSTASWRDFFSSTGGWCCFSGSFSS